MAQDNAQQISTDDPANPNVDASESTGGEGQTQNPDTQGDTTPKPKDDSLTKELVAELIEKARSEEKSKVYPKLESVEKEKKKALDSVDDLKKKLEDAQKSLNDVREGKKSEMASVNEELEGLRNQNKELEAKIVDVADTAKALLEASELKAYRAEKIQESEVTLTDLVKGTSQEEIDASIKVAKEKEEDLKNKLREDVRKELAANLPKPISPENVPTDVFGTASNYKTRQDIAKIKDPQEYARQRQKLLDEATRNTSGTG